MTQDSHAVSGHTPRHIMKAESKPKAIREGVGTGCVPPPWIYSIGGIPHMVGYLNKQCLCLSLSTC